MEKLLFILLVSMMYCINFTARSQALNAITYFKKGSEASGECKIIKSEINANEKFVTKTFQIEVGEAGYYYMNAWISGENIHENGEMMTTFGNDKEDTGMIQIEKYGYQNARLKNHKKIWFKKGLSQVSFTCKAPHVPAVDFINLSSSANSSISDIAYSNYVKQLSKNKIGSNYTQLKKQTQDLAAAARVLPNPGGNYGHEIDFNFSYTFYTSVYLPAGQSVTFSTGNTNSDPVMHLFNMESGKGSWTDDDSNGSLNSKITCTPSYSGTYCLLVRKFNSASPGTANVYMNGNLFASSVAVAGNTVVSNTNVSGLLNYFTTHNTGDPRIWVGDTGGTFPGNIRAYNDDYAGTGSFNWGYNSRVKATFSIPVGGVIVSAYSSSNPVGVCDVYLGCQQFGGEDSGPYKADDNIIAAPDYNPNTNAGEKLYNCFSWAGGRIDLGGWFCPYVNEIGEDNMNSWYDPNQQIAFDKFLGNNPPRFAGAPNYTRSGANATNGVIALWERPGEGFVHGSIRKGGNNMPHGYDWESKLGGTGSRNFHPRDVLINYGSITTYYRYAGSNAPGRLSEGETIATIEESIERGLTIMDTAQFTGSEQEKLFSLLNNIQPEIKNDFNIHYDAWKGLFFKSEMKWQNTLKAFLSTKEYKALIDYCSNEGKAVWPLLIDKIENEKDEFARQPFASLVQEEYQPLMNAVREQSIHRSKESYTGFLMERKSYIAPSPDANWTRFNKEVLKGMEPATINSSNPCEEGLNEISVCSTYPNPFTDFVTINFTTPVKANVKMKIYNVQGKEIASPIDNTVFEKGHHTITWNSKDKSGNLVNKGVYTYRLEANGEIRSGKLLKQ